MASGRAVEIFAYALMALAAGAGAYFWFGRDVTKKRVHYRSYTIGLGVALSVAGVLLGLAWWQVLVFAPAVTAITWYNLRRQRFCSSCTRPVDEGLEPLIIGLQECCRRCHAPLEPRGVRGRRTVALFASQLSADVAAARLAAEKIRSVALPTPSEFAAGENLIQLQVEPEDESRAREVLAEFNVSE